MQLDLESIESIEQAAAAVTKLLPEGLHALIGNAGANDQPKATFENLFVSSVHSSLKKTLLANDHIHRDLKLFSEELNLEIINNTVLIRAFLPLIRKSKAGKLIFISSILGSVELAAGMPTLNDAYAVSRAALNMLIRKWGGALKGEGIATAIIHPGKLNLSYLLPPTLEFSNAS